MGYLKTHSGDFYKKKNESNTKIKTETLHVKNTADSTFLLSHTSVLLDNSSEGYYIFVFKGVKCFYMLIERSAISAKFTSHCNAM